MQPEIDNRSQCRSNVFLTASLIAGLHSHPVRVRNLSTRGALLDGATFPPAGARVRLVRGELSADGQIAWQSSRHAGIRFSGEIDVNSWVKRIGHAGQQRVDDAIAALRSQQAPSGSLEAPAMSLTRISEELDAICERLAGSTAMSIELGEELVRLDALARALQRLAISDAG